jgi:hypothetical protein
VWPDELVVPPSGELLLEGEILEESVVPWREVVAYADRTVGVAYMVAEDDRGGRVVWSQVWNTDDGRLLVSVEERGSVAEVSEQMCTWIEEGVELALAAGATVAGHDDWTLPVDRVGSREMPAALAAFRRDAAEGRRIVDSGADPVNPAP